MTYIFYKIYYGVLSNTQPNAGADGFPVGFCNTLACSLSSLLVPCTAFTRYVPGTSTHAPGLWILYGSNAECNTVEASLLESTTGSTRTVN
jgi:hypothetical protein